ncbi:MAG: glycosyltransferase, partial [Allgaiera sp.]|nr:glycosyltransferase [Allgaiera sp.]
MRLVLAIPTAGRPALLSEVLHDIARQTRLPDFVVVSVSGAEDVDERALEDLPFPCMVVTGQKGASVQRNRAIELLGPEDVLLLLDDDFLMAPDYVAQTVQLFQDHPEVAVATGRVLADGISGPGYDYREGLARLQAGADAGAGGISEAYNGYGCNMAVRARPVLEHRLRFDEALPLYAWLEDVDFSRRVAAHGRVVRSEA